MRFFYIIIMFLCILHDLIHGIILPFCGPDFFYILFSILIVSFHTFLVNRKVIILIFFS